MFKCLGLASMVLSLAMVTNNGESATGGSNVIFLMFDDLGRNDIGLFGSEWDTPNLDAFIQDSVTLSHHYIGYVCSASRSQFLTGRYSFHNGYGTLNVFDVEKIGAMPLSTPTLMEYLKMFGSYSTFGIGKWQLGSPTYENMGSNRGFDHFWGFNGGMEDYRTKKHSMEGLDYVDFWYNLEPLSDWDDGYSTDQYVDKAIGIISEQAQVEIMDPFFMYIGFQAIHFPFSTDTSYYEQCESKAMSQIDMNTMSDRLGVCEAIVGVDYQVGRLLDYFQSSEKLQAIWDNTVIILTSDNGGDIDEGSCNYPLRGGKNTFFEGGQRVLAVVGGGQIPDSQRGVVLDGLVSNVDWFPTIMAFANLIPTDAKHVLFENNNNGGKMGATSSLMHGSETALVLDGYNMYEYIMSVDEQDALRDHIILHLYPRRQSNEMGDESVELSKLINDYEFDDFQEIAMLFYHEDGTLWKYVDVSESTNPVGNPGINSGWCVTYDEESTDSGSQLDNSEAQFTLVFDPALADTGGYLKLGLFDLTNDVGENSNYLQDGTSSSDVPTELLNIMKDKLKFYVNKDAMGSLNSDTMFGDFACFTDSTTIGDAVVAASEHDAWVPFYSVEEWKQTVITNCGLSLVHPIYKLLSNDLVLPDTLTTLDNSEQVTLLNNFVPEKSKFVQKRRVDEFKNKFSLDKWSNVEDIHKEHIMMDKHVVKESQSNIIKASHHTGNNTSNNNNYGMIGLCFAVIIVMGVIGKYYNVSYCKRTKRTGVCDENEPLMLS